MNCDELCYVILVGIDLDVPLPWILTNKNRIDGGGIPRMFHQPTFPHQGSWVNPCLNAGNEWIVKLKNDGSLQKSSNGLWLHSEPTVLLLRIIALSPFAHDEVGQFKSTNGKWVVWSLVVWDSN